MTAGFTAAPVNNSCAAMLYGGGNRRCDFYYPWNVPRERLVPQDDAPQDVNDGSALAYAVSTTGYGAVYGEFGVQEDDNYEFWRLAANESEGEQSSGNVARTKSRVQVLAGVNQSRFIVSCQPGPVSVKVFNSAGAVVAKLRASANAGRAELVWQRAGVPSGVYLYAVSCTSGVLTGKAVVVK